MMNHDDIKNEISMHFKNLLWQVDEFFKYLEKLYSKCIHCIQKCHYNQKLELELCIFNIYTYSSCIQSSRHNFENCLLPCFVPYSYLGHPSSQWRAHAAVRDKIM